VTSCQYFKFLFLRPFPLRVSYDHGSNSQQLWRYGSLWSPDLSPLDFCVLGYIKNKVYECKVYTRDKLLQWIFNAAVLRKVTFSTAEKVKMCTEAGGSHSERLLKWAVQSDCTTWLHCLLGEVLLVCWLAYQHDHTYKQAAFQTPITVENQTHIHMIFSDWEWTQD
jgi:hypothetical protein